VAADIVPVRLGLTKGDLYTLWAPRWRDAGDEWEAFLGKDEDLYAFESVADLAAFVRTDRDNDLTDHPAWEATTEASAHKLDPGEDRQYDVIGVADLVAEKPTDDSVTTLHRTLAIVSAIGSVCELPAVTKFFNGNPVLGSLGGGAETFSGRSGRKRWADIEAVIARGWDHVVDAIDEIISTPDVDKEASEKAAAELLEPPEPEADVQTSEDATDESDTEETTTEAAEDAEPSADESEGADTDDELVAEATGLVLGSDEDFWTKVGIDPVQLITGAGTFYTLRCYLDGEPIFLGRNGRVSVFSSERSMARYLADEHDHDLSDLATYDDIRTAATDGSLQVVVSDDNVYVLTGLSHDIADGPDAVDRDQLELAVEVLRDVGDYSEDDTVEENLDTKTALGRLVGHVLDPDTVRKPSGSYAKAVEQWEQLETFLESRLRPE
jgi:hypothetical protein